jgi:hypothetical protein
VAEAPEHYRPDHPGVHRRDRIIDKGSRVSNSDMFQKVVRRLKARGKTDAAMDAVVERMRIEKERTKPDRETLNDSENKNTDERCVKSTGSSGDTRRTRRHTASRRLSLRDDAEI